MLPSSEFPTVEAIVVYLLLSLPTPFLCGCEWSFQCICIVISFHPHHCSMLCAGGSGCSAVPLV